MRSTSISPCMMTMISNFKKLFIFHIFIFKFFLTNIADFCSFIFSSSSFVNNFFFSFLKLVIFIVHPLKNSQNLFVQSLPIYTSCFFSMLLNDNTVEIEKSDGICSPTFVVSEFWGLFLHPSIFSIKHSRST